ncbi:MAG: zinc dependent phospholipase C family protein [Ferruginibacter sp.]
MKKTLSRVILSFIFITGSVNMLFAWGMYGHQHINHAAVFALPREMRSFFYNHIDFITEESTVPDLRKYTLNDKSENPRHFIDIGEPGTIPIDSMPRTMKEAKAKYDDGEFQKLGMLPWYIQEMMEKLTKAFRQKRKTEVLFIAADLAHYLGDANMPLHTSVNHDGQLTGQRGIHSFFEAQLPEYFGDTYNYRVNDAVYLPDVTAATWDVIKNSNSLVDSMLEIEKQVKEIFPKDKILKINSKGDTVKNMFGLLVRSDEFATAYHKALGGMVEKQIRHSIQDVANFWYTAWVNAGKPDMSGLDPTELTKSNRKRYNKEMKLWKKGSLMGFNAEREYSR